MTSFFSDRQRSPKKRIGPSRAICDECVRIGRENCTLHGGRKNAETPEEEEVSSETPDETQPKYCVQCKSEIIPPFFFRQGDLYHCNPCPG